MFVICVEAIIYLLLYNLYGRTFKVMGKMFAYKILLKTLILFRQAAR